MRKRLMFDLGEQIGFIAMVIAPLVVVSFSFLHQAWI